VAQILVADHSTGGAIIGGTLKRDGFAGVVRYAAAGRPDVTLSHAELKDLQANGMPVAIVCEHEATWLLNTPLVTGRVKAALAITRALGLPDGVLYLAADFDATNGGPTAPGSKGDQQMTRILASLEAAATVIGQDNVGFYGSAFAIDWLVAKAPWIKWFWCTEAWSHGRPPHPQAQLYQRAASADVAGVQCDVNVRLQPNWGQRVTAAKPQPQPKPKPKPKPLPSVQQILAQILALLKKLFGG
jgi:hypothetical protein